VVFYFGIVLFSGLLAVLPPVTKDIQRAWLRNSASELLNIFSRTAALNVSLPEPILFSDQVSHEQAYFLFERIFSTYKTRPWKSSLKTRSLTPTWALVLTIWYNREREAWLALGREWIERRVVAEKARTVSRATGGIIWYRLTPEALRAVI